MDKPCSVESNENVTNLKVLVARKSIIETQKIEKLIIKIG